MVTVLTRRPRVGQEMNRQWTDLLMTVGPNVRWVEDDTLDLMEARPEEFLGYRVLPTVADSLPITMAGRRPHRVILFDAPLGHYSQRGRHAINELRAYLAWYKNSGVRWETWFVHRGIGIEKTGEFRVG